MKDLSLYKKAFIPDYNFPVRLFRQDSYDCAAIFPNHWHEQLEILYFIEGNTVIECNSIPINVEPGDLIVINSNELHCGYNPGNPVSYYCLTIDISLLHSSFQDSCEVKYISPITQNLIWFKNKIPNDSRLVRCFNNIVSEYEKKEPGYELSIKSFIYRLFVMLLRNSAGVFLTQKEYDEKAKKLTRLNSALKYIEEHYCEQISLEKLSELTGVSSFYFSHLFKNSTGRSVIDYINRFRTDKAEILLMNSNMNITEIALATGFNDTNYFSRIYRKYKSVSPMETRKKRWQ